MYLHNDKDNFISVINAVANHIGLQAQIIEKDYYVTLMLRFISKNLPFIVFKGGTSLSKCHRVINRFSEDIDLTIDRNITQGQKRSVKDTIKNAAEELGLEITNFDVIKSRKDYNRYIIRYESIVPLIDEIPTSNIIIETSYKTISFPTVRLEVSNYFVETFGLEQYEKLKELSLEPFEMKVQDINRTLVDKVFAICDYYIEAKTVRHSRHLYDIHKLLPMVRLDSEFKNLVAEVRNGRLQSKVCHSAKEGINPNEILKKIIKENTFKGDYSIITEKLLNEDVSYEEVIASLRIVVESEFFVF